MGLCLRRSVNYFVVCVVTSVWNQAWNICKSKELSVAGTERESGGPG